MRRIQFSMADLLCTITAVAILCMLGRYNGGFPGWTVLPTVFFVAAFLVARRGESSDVAWSLLAIAWCVALADMAFSLMGCFRVMGLPKPSLLQECFRCVYGSGIPLPLFLSIPTGYLAIKASKGSRSSARKWIVLCVVVGLADVTVLTALLHCVVEYWFD